MELAEPNLHGYSIGGMMENFLWWAGAFLWNGTS